MNLKSYLQLFKKYYVIIGSYAALKNVKNCQEMLLTMVMGLGNVV